MVKYYKALDAVTATTTSSVIPTEGAKKITLLLTRADHSSGSSAFSVDGSVDGVTFVTLNSMIEDLTNTNAQDYTRTASVTLSANGSKIAAVDLAVNSLKAIKVTVTETTDGTHSALVAVED